MRTRAMLIGGTSAGAIVAALVVAWSGAARGGSTRPAPAQAGPEEVDPRPLRTAAGSARRTADTLPRVAWDGVDRGTGILHFAELSAWGLPPSGGPLADARSPSSRSTAAT